MLTAVLYARASENVVEVCEEHLLPCGFNGFGVNLCACSCVSECNCGFSFGESAFCLTVALFQSRLSLLAAAVPSEQYCHICVAAGECEVKLMVDNGELFAYCFSFLEEFAHCAELDNREYGP